jgi:uncharacterized protein (DUF433 family)
MLEPSTDWSSCPGVEIDPKRQSGTPVFAGTRIPVNVVVNNIHHGGAPEEIEEILENFPMTREQVNLVLGHLQRQSSAVLELPLLRSQIH